MALRGAITGPEFFLIFKKILYVIENSNTNTMPYWRGGYYEYFRKKMCLTNRDTLRRSPPNTAHCFCVCICVSRAKNHKAPLDRLRVKMKIRGNLGREWDVEKEAKISHTHTHTHTNLVQEMLLSTNHFFAEDNGDT